MTASGLAFFSFVRMGKKSFSPKGCQSLESSSSPCTFGRYSSQNFLKSACPVCPYVATRLTPCFLRNVSVTFMRGCPPSKVLRKAFGTPTVVAGSLPADHTTSASFCLSTGPSAYSTDE